MNLACGVCIEKCVCAHCAGKMGRCSFGTHTVGCDHPRAYTLSSAARKSRVSRFYSPSSVSLAPGHSDSRLSSLRTALAVAPWINFFKTTVLNTPPAGRGYGRGHAPRMQNLPWRPARSQFSHLTSSNRFGDCGSPKVFRVTPYVLYTYRCGCVFLRRTFEGARATPDAASDTMPVCQSDRQTESPCPGSWSHLVADVPPC